MRASRSVPLPAFLASIATGIPLILGAQGPAAAVGPRPGSWAAEAVVSPYGVGPSLLRFRSTNGAWILGAIASGYQRHQESDELRIDRKISYFTADARIGYRHHGGSGTTPRCGPSRGAGLLGAHTRASGGSRGWSAGAYGELGIVYFHSPHVSFGSAGEVRGAYARSTGRVRSREIYMRATLVRALATVYF